MAKLKKSLPTLDGVADGIKTLYTKQDDGSFLFTGVEGLGDVAEFRETNTGLQKKVTKLEEQLKPFDGIDATKLKTALTALSEKATAEEKTALEKGNFDKVLSGRLDAQKTDFEGRIGKKDKLIESQREQLQLLKVGSMLTDATDKAKVKIKTGALGDLKSRAEKVWQYDEEGKLVATGADGQPRTNVEGNPLQPDEWIKGLVTDAPHLFEPGKGGGSGGGGGDTTTTTVGGRDVKVVPDTDENLIKYAPEIAKGEVVLEGTQVEQTAGQ